MDGIVQAVPKSWIQVSDFHFHIDLHYLKLNHCAQTRQQYLPQGPGIIK